MAAAIPEEVTGVHEYARVSDPYRELAASCIRDAIKCLDLADGYRSKLRIVADENLRIYRHGVWKGVICRARVYWYQLENDIDWMRRPGGYSLWVCATALSDDEAEAVRDEYLRRAEPLLGEYDEALLRWGRGYVQREGSRT